MAAAPPTRILVITDRAAATPILLDAILARAAQGPVEVRILVANPAPAEWHPTHPERHEKADAARLVLDEALPGIRKPAGVPVDGVVSTRHNPMEAVEETLHDEPFDEIHRRHRPPRAGTLAARRPAAPPLPPRAASIHPAPIVATGLPPLATRHASGVQPP